MVHVHVHVHGMHLLLENWSPGGMPVLRTLACAAASCSGSTSAAISCSHIEARHAIDSRGLLSCTAVIMALH